MSVRARLAAVLAVIAAALLPATDALAGPGFSDGDGLHVLGVQRLDDRLVNIHVATDALEHPVDLRILLPTGYDAHPTQRYPVLYLFHGTSGRASDWTTLGGAEATTARRNLIVVMPDAGYDGDGGGWFTNWFNGGRGGRPQWETFHVDEVIPWIDHTLRTVASRDGRAIYGLSQGGFGSMTYAARHPDMFVAAGAYSGAVETSADARAQLLVTPIVQATAFGLDGKGPDDMFGPRATQEINWAAHDPGVLATNLRGLDLRFYTGDGRAGPLASGLVDPIEAGVHELTLLLHRRLERLGIPSALRDYGPGTHAWAYWARDLRDTMGPLAETFADPPPAPARVSYRAGDGHWSAWGYDVTMHRPAREMSALREGDARGFTLSGSGSATVVTPPVYRPGSAATVRMAGDRVDETTSMARADDGGRLRLDVPLGPGNPAQQDTAAAELSGGTKVFSTRVRITGVARATSARERAHPIVRRRPSHRDL